MYITEIKLLFIKKLLFINNIPIYLYYNRIRTKGLIPASFPSWLIMWVAE